MLPLGPSMGTTRSTHDVEREIIVLFEYSRGSGTLAVLAQQRYSRSSRTLEYSRGIGTYRGADCSWQGSGDDSCFFEKRCRSHLSPFPLEPVPT